MTHAPHKGFQFLLIALLHMDDREAELVLYESKVLEHENGDRRGGTD